MLTPKNLSTPTAIKAEPISDRIGRSWPAGLVNIHVSFSMRCSRHAIAGLAFMVGSALRA